MRRPEWCAFIWILKLSFPTCNRLEFGFEQVKDSEECRSNYPALLREALRTSNSLSALNYWKPWNSDQCLWAQLVSIATEPHLEAGKKAHLHFSFVIPLGFPGVLFLLFIHSLPEFCLFSIFNRLSLVTFTVNITYRSIHTGDILNWLSQSNKITSEYKWLGLPNSMACCPRNAVTGGINANSTDKHRILVDFLPHRVRIEKRKWTHNMSHCCVAPMSKVYSREKADNNDPNTTLSNQINFNAVVRLVITTISIRE